MDLLDQKLASTYVGFAVSSRIRVSLYILRRKFRTGEMKHAPNIHILALQEY